MTQSHVQDAYDAFFNKIMLWRWSGFAKQD